jgi:UDP-N-acetylglucosamine--N-acetylmuramyl-(pentapeptide) pyrophosphoryl-undecaprenol N-acetylglucosamine transferase
MTQPYAPTIAIACGGTGGHLFPGLAVAEQLVKRGCAVMVIVSPKEVDQQAVKSALERRAPARQGDGEQQAEQVLGAPIEVVTLPAVGLQNRNYFSFARSFVKSWLAARKALSARKPVAALAMGGFTSAPPIFAAKQFGARTFLHESNTIPGKANRWLSRFVDECFVGFPQAASRLHSSKVVTTGTPVRPQFKPRDAAACRTALGLDPNRPTVLVMGGSQGASGINDLIIGALDMVKAGRARHPVRRSPGEDGSARAAEASNSDELQFFHLSGSSDAEKVRKAYAEKNLRAVVHGFFAEMDTALGAATVAVSRSGASSLAEIAAMRVPSVLVPYPAATDNHQFFNAQAFQETGAAHLLEQKNSTPEKFAELLLDLVTNAAAREKMQSALAQWHAPQAAEQIAETMLKLIAQETEHAGAEPHDAGGGCGCGGEHRHELRAKSAA